MSAQAGRNLLIKIKNESDDFITLAGLRTKTLRFNARSVDVTDSESLDAWRELLPGAGTKSVEISGAGSVSYRGTPSNINTRISGAGELINAN